MSESNGSNGAQGHLWEKRWKEGKQGLCYLGVSPGMGTLHRWQPPLQQSVPDLSEDPVAKLGLAATPEKVEKVL